MRIVVGLSLLLVACLGLACPGLVWAQNKKGGEEKISATGTVKAIAPGALQVVSAAGDQWIVALAPKAEVIVTGTAAPSFLKPGMLVKFTGKFNKKAETVDALKTLTVYTPREDWGNRRPQREEGTNPALTEATKNLFKFDAPEPKKPVKPMREKPMKGPDTFDVSSAGAIASVKGSKVQVRGAEAAFKIELTEDAMVNLDVNDYRLAKAGDRIEIEGYANPMDKTQVLATRITIRLTEPLGEIKKPAEKPAEDKPAAEKPETTEKKE